MATHVRSIFWPSSSYLLSKQIKKKSDKLSTFGRPNKKKLWSMHNFIFSGLLSAIIFGGDLLESFFPLFQSQRTNSFIKCQELDFLFVCLPYNNNNRVKNDRKRLSTLFILQIRKFHINIFCIYPLLLYFLLNLVNTRKLE